MLLVECEVLYWGFKKMLHCIHPLKCTAVNVTILEYKQNIYNQIK